MLGEGCVEYIVMKPEYKFSRRLPKVIKLVLCSTHLNIQFILLQNVKMPMCCSGPENSHLETIYKACSETI